jgi:hypothetical protein
VPASAIQWIRPREAWWLNRRLSQPHALLPELYRGLAIRIETAALATSTQDLFARLEAAEAMLRLDPGIRPTPFRGALVSEAELTLLRRIEDVVRLGRVRRIERDRIVLDHGCVPTDETTLHVHCAAAGLARPALRPIFEPGRVTVQPMSLAYACYQFAMLGVVEATVDSDDEKDRLCPPIQYWDADTDYLSALLASVASAPARAAHPALTAWMKSTRLNPLSGLALHADNPIVIEARERIER